MAPPHSLLWKLIALLVLSLTAGGQLLGNDTALPGVTHELAAGARNGRVFSLFSVVQFPNSACTTNSGTYTNGTCFTSSECSSKGGTSYGNCAAGFGVCCVFTVSTTGTTISENCTYIVNPSYPSNYVPTTTPATLTYTISKCQDDICRIRLDYDTFTLTQPLSGASLTEGTCTKDKLVFTTSAETILPASNTGNYGSYPYLCGTNTGLHSYLDLSLTSTDTATLTFTIGDSTNNQFKIKVTQLSCSDYTVAQQQQCFQYFTGPTGTFSSYNYAGAQMLAFTQYNACIRQEADHCCIQWSQLSSTSFRAAGGRVDAAIGTLCAGAIAAQLCSAAQGCSLDFVLIPNSGASSMGLAGGGSSTADRYCGPALSPLNAIAAAPVISCEIPFRIGHQTSGISVCGTDGTPAIAATTAACSQNSQFQLTFSQIPGTC